MFQHNPLQFAVTREDPRTESGVLDDWSARAGRRDPRVLLIASGGCTPLALQARWPDATICLVDPNPAQLDHVRQKILARDADETSRLISGGPGSLLERGNFEGLFRVLRGVLHDFVAPPEAWERLISGDMARLSDLLESPWWVTAFEVAFSDALLLRMFGPAAVQHAAPGSYPGWFRHRIEQAILDPAAATNPFLAHILLGRYTGTALPDWLLSPPPPAWRLGFRCCTLQDITDWPEWDLLQLSNVPDWMAPDTLHPLLHRIGAAMRPGARLLIRQLNNRRRLESHCPMLRFDRERARELLQQDRSMFYSRILIGVKPGDP